MTEHGKTGRIDRFEDLIAWQMARSLTRDVYRVTKQSPLNADRALTSQLQRASVSIMSNLAEGFERGGRGEFNQFLSIAKASCAEVRSLLYVALDAELIDDQVFGQLNGQAHEVARVVSALRTAVARQQADQRSPNGRPPTAAVSK